MSSSLKLESGINIGVPSFSYLPAFRLYRILFLASATLVSPFALGQTATTTSLTVTSGGNPVTAITAGTVVTLTASVTAGSAVVPHGQLNFCDASSVYCTDIHLLGAAQLNSLGTAQLRLRPGVGSYSYKAIFVGTLTTTVPYAGSTSATSSLTVTGQPATFTTITQSGSSGDYTLTASVLGFTKSQTIGAPTGTVTFTDITTNNSLLSMAALTPASGPGWINVSNPTVGSLPANLMAADFNNDGNLDLAVGINSVSGSGPVSASIVLGDGQGNFTPVAGNSAFTGGVPLAVADFDQDGIPDLLLSDTFSGSITIDLGKGDGTFTPAPGGPLVSNYGVFPVAIGDFNGDGIPDFAAAGGFYLITWLGNGDGTFTKLPIAGSYFPADSFYSMTVGDFNGDGYADIGATYLGGPTVTILLGNGDGTFTAAAPLNSAYGPASTLAAADFNGDGRLDLAAPGANSVSVFLGNGDGTFQTAGNAISLGQYLNRVAVADFNGDGVPDLFVGAQTNLTDVFILLGNGDGTFSLVSPGPPQVPCCSNTLVGDFNGDGVSDLASSDFYNASVNVSLTGAKQSTASIAGISVSGPTPQQAIASYPGDGNYSSSQSGPTALLAQAAAPVFTPPSGAVIVLGQTVSLASSTPGASISYQASGAIQTNGFVQYVGPVSAYNTGSITLQAYANAYNYGQSATATATYTVISSAPVPVLSSVSPAFAAAAGQSFTLTLNGSGFITDSTVYWGSTQLNTQFVSSTQLAAQISSIQIASEGARSITVQTPAPGGGTSNILQFEVDSGGGSAPSFTVTSATVAAGSSAIYPVTFPPTASSVSVICLNLPAGATCSYSASSGALTIATSGSTPPGAYQVTAVFTETLAGTSLLTLGASLFVPFGFAATRRRNHRVWLCLLVMGLVSLTATSCGGGSTTQPQAHSVTSSGVITLTVQ